MAVHHSAVTVVLICVNQAPWVFLDTVEGVVVVSTVSVANFHGRREVQAHPDGVALMLTKACSAAIFSA